MALKGTLLLSLRVTDIVQDPTSVKAVGRKNKFGNFPVMKDVDSPKFKKET